MKKVVSVFLVLSMVISLSVPVWAVDEGEITDDSSTQSEVTGEILYVEDDDGNLVEVYLEEETRYPDGYVKPDALPFSFSPEVPVGTTKTYTVKISNAQVMLLDQVGTKLTKAQFKKIADLAADAIAKKIGVSLMPGIELASDILFWIGAANILCGNEGFEVTVTMTYSAYYSQREDYYIYGYEVTDAGIDTY